jgi:amino acid permease
MKHEFAFSKINFILLAIGIAIVMVGLLLMSGGGTTVEQFDPEIFNAQRIRVAPMVTFFGYLFIVVAILYRRKSNSTEVEYNKKEN